MTATVKSFVDSINAALGKIDTLAAYDATTKTSGPLAGDAGVRELRNAVLNAVYPTDGTSLASVGIQLDRYGKLTFDEATFTEAYAADPSGVAAKFTTGASDGFAARIQTVDEGGERPDRRHDHHLDQRPQHPDQGPPGQHRQLGHPARPPAELAPAAVHRAGNRAEPDEQPVQLAVRTTRLTQSGKLRKAP